MACRTGSTKSRCSSWLPLRGEEHPGMQRSDCVEIACFVSFAKYGRLSDAGFSVHPWVFFSSQRQP